MATLPACAADVRLDAYRNPRSEALRSFNQVYLDGVKGGLLAFDARIRSRGGQPSFCPPAGIAITTGQAEEIMLRSADKRSAAGDTLVASLLLAGMQDTFPCDAGGAR